MLRIQKNSVNECYLTLREKSSVRFLSTTANTSYLFSFVNGQTNDVLNFIPVQISSTNRYDRFQIIESGVTYQNLTAGTIHLSNPYFYTYHIYENYSGSPYNLIISATTNQLIETGKVLFSGTSVGIYASLYSGNHINNIFYNQNP